MLLLLIGCQTAESTLVPQPTEAPPTTEPTTEPETELTTEPAPTEEPEPILDGLVLLEEGISLRQVVATGFGSIKLAINPQNNELYVLRPTEGLFHVTLGDSPKMEKVSDITELTADGLLAGMKFGPDGTLYVVLNRRPEPTLTQAAVYKGTFSDSGDITWTNFATTEPYPASNTNFDHVFNGITISPDNQWVYLNSGSRTDHGEVEDTEGAFPDMREVAMTTRIFRIPTAAEDFTIPNDEEAQNELGIIFAKGTRNAYDLEFAPNGDLFGIDNGPDADYSDELNWLREGHHYGFPWRFGNQDNPQQFPDYDPSQDNRLSEDFVAVQWGTYANDPDYPPPPPQEFTDPVINLGPDAAQYRDDEGNPQAAVANGETLQTFTPHRSQLGIVFVDNAHVPASLQSRGDSLNMFMVSWGAAGGDLTDQGQDLLHLILTKNGDNYEAVTTQIAHSFKRPIDAVMIENHLYILEWDGDGVLWELTFE